MQPLYSRLILERLKRALLIITLIILLILALSTGSLIYSSRADQIRQTGDSIQIMSIILSKESDATLTLASTILEELASHFKLDENHQFLDKQQIHRELKNYRNLINEQTGNASFAHLFVVNSAGYNVANSVSYPVKKVSTLDRDYYRFHQSTPDKSLHISQPLYSKVTGERVILLTRRISDENGNFDGIIGIQLKLSHFDRLYQQLNLPPGGTVTVIRSDGQGIYRYPLVDTFLQKSIKEHADFQQMIQLQNGYLNSAASPYDGHSRLVGFKLNEKYPLVNIISLTEDTVLKHWVENSIKTLLLAGFAGLTLLVMVYFTYQQLCFLDKAIHLSNHDPLTSLWNRRAFDEHLDEEWRRVRRREGDIALLFIDIDYFKKYNDHYGHHKGDTCLVKIANAIAQFAERSGEMVSRYGGEEFVVLLPESDTETAYKVAQRIQLAISNLAIPHARSPASDHITLSVGLASVKPVEGMEASILLHRADDALYDAKEGGRNRICVYTEKEPNSERQASLSS